MTHEQLVSFLEEKIQTLRAESEEDAQEIARLRDMFAQAQDANASLLIANSNLKAEIERLEETISRLLGYNRRENLDP